MYDRPIGRVASSRNVSFVEETPAAVPTTSAAGEIETGASRFVSDADPDFLYDHKTIDNDITYHGGKRPLQRHGQDRQHITRQPVFHAAKVICFSR